MQVNFILFCLNFFICSQHSLLERAMKESAKNEFLIDGFPRWLHSDLALYFPINVIPFLPGMRTTSLVGLRYRFVTIWLHLRMLDDSQSLQMWWNFSSNDVNTENLRRWVTRWICVGCSSSTAPKRSVLLGTWFRSPNFLLTTPSSNMKHNLSPADAWAGAQQVVEELMTMRRVCAKDLSHMKKQQCLS